MDDNRDILVGKYTLESLTTGMYSNPLIIYREYIQNSVDALDCAIENKILDEKDAQITITINTERKEVIVYDNGIGLSTEKAPSTLLNIGNSEKRSTNNRGFRGIGRLGGMSYCDKLIFTTSFKGEDKKTVITYDCKKLKELLIPGQYDEYDLERVLKEITTTSIEKDNIDEHYFCVKLEEISDTSILLKYDIVMSYITEVAPLNYLRNEFTKVDTIDRLFDRRNLHNESFKIVLSENDKNHTELFKPYKDVFYADRNKKREDRIIRIKTFEIRNKRHLYAVGWYADCKWLGSLSQAEVSGLRVRKGNILIGDSKTLNDVFKETRFNGWVQGEVFVVSDRLIPNARRDDFEKNDDYYCFIESLKNTVGTVISTAIREASKERNDFSKKILATVSNAVKDAKQVERQGFNSNVEKSNTLELLNQKKNEIEEIKTNDPSVEKKKEAAINKLDETIVKVESSDNFKVNKINTNIDSREMLEIIADILSKVISKTLADMVLDQIKEALKGRRKKK